MRSLLSLLLIPLLAFLSAACGDARTPVILAATTSTYDSGLLEVLIAAFNREHGAIRIRTVVMGSGEALELGRRGDADVLLIHAPEAEDHFIEEGYAVERVPVMYNDFVILGPASDPAEVVGTDTPGAAFEAIAQSRALFVSRGDSSGTHYRELALWKTARIDVFGPWYVESGQGQGTSLQIASERAAYTISDRATFTVLQDILELKPLFERHQSLFNLYSVIQPSEALRKGEAQVFVNWLTSESGQEAILQFRHHDTEEPLFRPLVRGSTNPGLSVPDLEEMY